MKKSREEKLFDAQMIGLKIAEASYLKYKIAISSAIKIYAEEVRQMREEYEKTISKI